jgi:hypothetical protein
MRLEGRTSNQKVFFLPLGVGIYGFFPRSPIQLDPRASLLASRSIFT